MPDRLKRRDFLARGAAVSAAGLIAGCGGESAESSGTATPTSGTTFGNFPVTGDTVTFGLTIPQTGPYQPEGESELRGYKLAIRDLNNNRGWVGSASFTDLSGNGLLGKTVDYKAVDTAVDPETAVPAAQGLIEDDDVIMFTGGASSAVAVALHEVAQKNRVIYMDCLTHANATTGADCSRYAFRMMFNAEMSAAALVPVLLDKIGPDPKKGITEVEFYQLYADYNWGQNLQSSIKSRFGDRGWTEIGSTATRLGQNDYRTALKNAQAQDPDVVFLNQFGLDGATALRQADKILGDKTDVVMPLYDRPMAELAGGAIEGVFGTVAWDATVDTALSIQFIEHFQNEFARVPDGLAYLAYAQTLLYASSVARAGSFNPADVISDLEGRSYEAALGEETMRECDHQAVRPVPVARGLPASEQGSGNFFEVVRAPKDMPYDCDESIAAECDLGPVQ